MDASPLTLQLAARVERHDPPTVAEIASAASVATLRLLADDRSAPGGAWHAEVAAWNGDRIRKLVRRARASGWERVQAVPGITAAVGRAEVRAFVPCPRDSAPAPVQRLQIHSPPLPAPDLTHHLPSGPDTPALEVPDTLALTESREGPATMVLAVAPEPAMTWGKQVAQCAHGAQRLVERASPPRGWLDDPKILVLHPCAVLWQRLGSGDPVEIRDGGYTEIPAGTLTVRAQWYPARTGVRRGRDR